MENRYRYADSWKYGAGAIAALVLFGILILLVGENAHQLLTWQFYLGNDFSPYNLTTWAITAIGGGLTLLVIIWRTSLFNNQLKQQLEDQLERQFEGAINRLTSGEDTQLAGALAIQELSDRYPERFAMRSLMALIAVLRKVEPVTVNDAESEYRKRNLRTIRLETAIIFGKIRLQHHNHIIENTIRQAVRNHPPIVVQTEVLFIEAVDFTWLSIVFDATFVAISKSRLQQTSFDGYLGDSLYLDDNEMFNCRFRQTGGDTYARKCNLHSAIADVPRWRIDGQRHDAPMAEVFANDCLIDSIHRADRKGCSFTFESCWYENNKPNLDRPGMNFHTNKNDVFAISEGIQTGFSHLGMALYKKTP